jgi:hypothetical protein
MGKKIISHRGNIDGKQPNKENLPNYIDNALNLGYDVEIDIWVIEGSYYLGHDEPLYGITQHWLNKRKNKLWVHCKNLEAVEWFNSIGGFNYFWHETDTITLTSKNYIWAYPGKQPIKNSIAVLPEIHNENLNVCRGVCSDNIKQYKNIIK